MDIGGDVTACAEFGTTSSAHLRLWHEASCVQDTKNLAMKKDLHEGKSFFVEVQTHTS